MTALPLLSENVVGTASSVTEKPVEASSPLVAAYLCLTPRKIHIAEDVQRSTKLKQKFL